MERLGSSNVDNEKSADLKPTKNNQRLIPLTDEINQIINELKRESESPGGDHHVKGIRKAVNKELQNSLHLISKELAEQNHLSKAFDSLMLQRCPSLNKPDSLRTQVEESLIKSYIKNEHLMNYFASLDDRIRQVDDNITNIVNVLKSNLEDNLE